MRKLEDFISHMIENIHEPIILVGVIALVVHFRMPDPLQFIWDITHPIRASYIERMWLP